MGSAGFSAGFAKYTSLALHPTTGAPYVAYSDFGNSNAGKASVMTCNGSAWSTVGVAGFSDGSADWISLALHPTTDAPYVAYQDGSGKATVQTFNGSAWSAVGAAGFSAGYAAYTSLALHPSTGAPYVAYQDSSASYKVTVMSFD